MDADMAKYVNSAPKKKPAGKAVTKKRKKAADIDDEDEEDEEEEAAEEDEADEEAEDKPAIVKGTPKATKKAMAKTKVARRRLSLKTSPASAVVAAKSVAEPPATMKRPAAIGATSLGRFPKVDRNQSVYWGGGRLYTAAGDMVRVYARSTDREDKRFKYKDSASFKAAWDKACRRILEDPRERHPPRPRGKPLAI